MSIQTVIPKTDKTLIKECRGCHRKETSDQKMLRCSICKKVNYCNVSCQRKDWNEHKVVCKPPETKIEKKCHTCSKTKEQLKATAEKLKKCSKCLEVYYCSKKCQEKSWPKHKEVCQRPVKVPNSEKCESKKDPTILEIDKAFSTCWACKKTDIKTFECATCHFARYCTTECQDNNAELHNVICKRATNNYVLMDHSENREKAMHIVTVRRFQEKLTPEKIEQIQGREALEEIFHLPTDKVFFYS